jgi:quercetin dioxygenase-like cupin family protein
MASSFTDHRGTIEDILDLGGEPLNGVVTRIYTKAGEVRGNHVHKLTTQWTYVVDGLLIAASPAGQTKYYPGSLFEEPAGVPHAWRAETNTTVLVFTRGPRSGEDYESDTERLPEGQRLL